MTVPRATGTVNSTETAATSGAANLLLATDITMNSDWNLNAYRYGAGATAVEMTSAVMAGGSRVVRESLQALSAYLAQRQQNASALIGLAADRLQGYAEQSPRPDYWQRFVSAEARSIQIDEQSSPPTNERSKP